MASAPSAASNSRSITHLESCPSPNPPTIFSDEPLVRATTNSRVPWLPGRYSGSSLLRTRPLPCSADFATGRGGFLQLLSMSLSQCCPYFPAEVFRRFSPCDAPCCLRLTKECRLGLRGADFRGHYGFTY